FTETFFFIVFYTLMAFFIQAIVNHKFLGYTLVILFFIIIDIFPEWGWDHSLLSFAEASLGTYSDMNKYGHFLNPFTWENIYWFGFSTLFFVLSVFVSARGTDNLLKQRIKSGRYKLTRPILILAFSSFMLFSLSGCYIYYNTNVLNDHTTEKDIDQFKADYEKALIQFEYIPQPTITDVNLNVEIYPHERNFQAKGVYSLKNRTDQPIENIHIQNSINPGIELRRVQFDGGAMVKHQYPEFNYSIYTLNQSLAPGDSIKMEFEIDFTTRGFVDNFSNTDVVYNGTFFNNYYFPKIGYNSNYELDKDKKRKKHGLAPKERMLPRDDMRGRTNPVFGNNQSHINFEIVVGTSGDQIAIAPGYLIKSWEDNNRNYFRYKMDVPIFNFYSIVSAEYEIMKDSWNGVNLEIYYHKEHDYNLDRMMNSMKKSLEYYSKSFGPYQYRQLRIMEFPRYEVFAQSFANTIPFSEGIGFIMDVDNSEYDTPFYVTAHEVGHQWWAHQVCEANTKGATFLSESITQYSAMMVMKHSHPEEEMQKFLRYELDKYLRGRAGEEKKELPLMDVENQAYIHYNKGSVIMYAFQDYVSEDSVNIALQRYLNEWKFRDDLYPTSADLLKEFRKVTPDSLQYLITDFFETITFYENKVETVDVEQVEENKYRVTLSIDSQKFRADSLGKETEIAINDWIDIGVYAKDKDGKDKLVYLKKHKIDNPMKMISVEVYEKPVSAGIDPLNKLIDRHPDDNVKSAEGI
nr:aminopeptidase [Bacteroidota bacterium]